MSNKLDLLSTMNYHTKRRTTFTEFVELVDSVEKVPLSTSFFQMMPSSSEKSKITTTLKLRRCHKTSKISQSDHEQEVGTVI